MVLRVEVQHDLQRAIGVDEEDDGLGADDANIRHPQAGGRRAVTVGDPQRRRPGWFLVVGRIGQGVPRRWDPSRQPLHMGIDVRPEPRLA